MDVYNYLIVIKWVEMIFGLVGQAIIGLLRFIRSLAAKCIPLNNKPCIASSTFTDLTPNKYSRALRHYLYMVSWDECDGSCSTLDDLPSRICIPNRAADRTWFKSSNE